jgi:hypothetical protein
LKIRTMKIRNFRASLLLGILAALLMWMPGRADAAPAVPDKKIGAKPALKRKGEAKQLPGFGKYRVIRIDSDGVFPRILRVEAGSTAIWFNAMDRYTSVVFNEGDTLRRATRSPTLFFLAPDGTYVSAAFGPGAVASAAFVRPGTYYYFVTGLPVADGGAFAQVVVAP